MEIETKLVNSKLFLRDRLIFYLMGFLFLLLVSLTYGRQGRNIIVNERFQWFFKDPETFLVWARYFEIGSGALMAAFGLKYLTHDLGTFKLNEQRLYAKKTAFPLVKMTQLKFIINSPSVFGRRNSRQGFKNLVEFLMNREKKRYEFYIENQAMEDALMNLIAELKTKHTIEVVVDKRSKESLFDSWFGYG